MGAYKKRSITGVRPKDEEKVETLREVIMPNDRMGDIPGEYREQHLAFLEQYRKLESERKRLGLIGLKAHVLSTLERNPALVELAQGKHQWQNYYRKKVFLFIIRTLRQKILSTKILF